VGKLRITAAALALVASTPAGANAVDRWRPYVDEASIRFGVPVSWIERVMRAESGGQTSLNGRPITSSAGAMGLMQLMPGTWAAMRTRLGLGADPHQPRDNIMAGAAYLRLMYDRFGYPGLFAAYNAGPQRYAEHLTLGRALPLETVDYVARVADRRLAPSRRQGLVIAQGATPMQPAQTERGGLFFIRRTPREIEE
jgi:soluble lytic murein transglycosylase-like protein